jgi:hypothetical protein
MYPAYFVNNFSSFLPSRCFFFLAEALFLAFLDRYRRKQKTAAQPLWSEQPFALLGFLRFFNSFSFLMLPPVTFLPHTNNPALSRTKSAACWALAAAVRWLYCRPGESAASGGYTRDGACSQRDTGMGAEEGGADLGHQLLEGIAKITEAGAEHPVQPAGVA